MNNLLSYCGLVDAKIRASDIDSPVMSNKLGVVEFIESNLSMGTYLSES